MFAFLGQFFLQLASRFGLFLRIPVVLIDLEQAPTSPHIEIIVRRVHEK
jgi:hypothetical protein